MRLVPVFLCLLSTACHAGPRSWSVFGETIQPATLAAHWQADPAQLGYACFRKDFPLGQLAVWVDPAEGTLQELKATLNSPEAFAEISRRLADRYTRVINGRGRQVFQGKRHGVPVLLVLTQAEGDAVLQITWPQSWPSPPRAISAPPREPAPVPHDESCAPLSPAR